MRQCELLGVARSSWYRHPAGESELNVSLMHLIDEEYTRHPFYGSRQMCHYLRRLGHGVNRKRVRRLMQTMGLEALYPKPRLSRQHREHRVFPYLLRGVPVRHVDQVWSTDITYLRLAGGFAYLVAYMDWFSRFVLSYEVSTTLDHQFCVSALNAALAHGKADIHNTDQGSQFTCEAFVAAVKAAGMEVSMDGKGRALDNVFVERLWRTVKYEDVYLKDYGTPREAADGLGEYFEFYNYERPHRALGGRSPASVYVMKQCT